MHSSPDAPTAAVRPHDDSLAPPRDEGSISLWQYVDLLWRYRILVIGVTLAAAAIATLMTFLTPRRYSAEATVFLTPPSFVTSLRPEAMTVEAYAELAQTEHVLSLVAAELRKRYPALFESAQRREGGGAIAYSTRLSASREPQKPYLPLIGLGVVAESPELAQAAANTWADVFVAEQAKISSTAVSSAADFILQEHPKLEQVLADAEQALQSLLAKQAQELAALKSQVGLSLRTAELESYEWMVVQQEDALAAAQRTRDRLGPSVAQLEAELRVTPQYLAGSPPGVNRPEPKPDEASGAGAAGAPPPGQLNPVYVALSQRLAEERVNLNALTPQIQSLEKHITETRRKAAEVRRALLEGERRIAEMERRHLVAAASLERAVTLAEDSLDDVSDKVGEARLAQSAPGQNLKLGAYAGLPSSPSGPRRSLVVASITFTVLVVTSIALLAFGLLRRRYGESATRL